MDRSDMILLTNTTPEKCIRCGRCSAACPAASEMDILPHLFVSRVLKGDYESLISSQSILKCLSCFCCAERCPRNLEPVKIIEAARLMHLRQQGQAALTPEDVPALLDENMPQQLLVSAFRKFRG